DFQDGALADPHAQLFPKLPLGLQLFIAGIVDACDVAGQVPLDRSDRAEFRAARILLAMTDVDHVAVNCGRNIDAAARKMVFPNLLPRLRLEGIEPAGARARQQHFLPVEYGDRRATVDGVFGTKASSRLPVNFPRRFVEAE